jgi:hypothetical protein
VFNCCQGNDSQIVFCVFPVVLLMWPTSWFGNE